MCTNLGSIPEVMPKNAFIHLAVCLVAQGVALHTHTHTHIQQLVSRSTVGKNHVYIHGLQMCSEEEDQPPLDALCPIHQNAPFIKLPHSSNFSYSTHTHELVHYRLKAQVVQAWTQPCK